MTIKTYSEALSYIYSFITYNPANTQRWSLERLQEMLVRLGHPQQQYPSLLIAGTKGKGSTSAMCESILRAAGYKTGLYTSPHLHSFRERIRIGGQPIAEETLIDLLNRLRPTFEATPNLTIFELKTALAFTAFAEANVQAGVIEVGLGGRLDATNSIEPTVAVITPISYDHMQILGDTLTLIATEKAGIIRPQARVVTATQADEALAVIDKVCQAQQAHLTAVERDYTWSVNQYDLDGQTFTLSQNEQNHETYRLPLLGEHQVVNAITALTAVRAFGEQLNAPIPSSAIESGLQQVTWLGRLEILHRRPYVLVDSAMNGDSAEKLAVALQQNFPHQPITFLIGMSNDHPMDHVFTALKSLAKRMYVVASRHPRAATPHQLAQAAATADCHITPMPDVPHAIQQLYEQAAPDEIICVTGSLFLAADARESWLKLNHLPLPPIDPPIEIRMM